MRPLSHRLARTLRVTHALEVNRGCAASGGKEWWAGTGLNRRLQDFQSAPRRRAMHHHRPTLLTNHGASEGRGPEIHAMTDRGRRCFRQSSGKVNGPPTAVLALRADQETGQRAERKVQSLTIMTHVRSSHRTGSLWATLSSPAWPAVDIERSRRFHRPP